MRFATLSIVLLACTVSIFGANGAPQDPRSRSTEIGDTVTKELIEEKRSMHVKLNQGLYEAALEDLDRMLNRLSAAVHKSDNEDFLAFVGQCWKERIYCLRQLHRFPEALADCKKMLDLSYRINDHAKAYSVELTQRVLKELNEKIRDEMKDKSNPMPSLNGLYIVLGVPATATKVDVEKAYKKILLTVHPDKLGKLDGEAKEMMDTYFQMATEARDFLISKISS